MTWNYCAARRKRVETDAVSKAEAESRAETLRENRKAVTLPMDLPVHFRQYAPRVCIKCVQLPGQSAKLDLTQIMAQSVKAQTPRKPLVKMAEGTDELQSPFWKNGSLITYDSQGRQKEVATYYITFSEEVQEIGPQGVIDKYVLRIIVRDNEFEYVVKKESLYDIKNSLTKVHPECIVRNGQEEAFRTHILSQFLKFQHNKGKNPYKIYHLFGWYEFGDKIRFMHAGLKGLDFEVRGTLALTSDFDKATDFYNKFSLTAPPQITLLLLLYTLYAYMAGLYQHCCTDEGCRSVMYLAGRTGSGKTSLVKVLTAWLKKAGLSVELRFDDTLASLQENLVKNRDLVTLVDDFYPKATKSATLEFQRKAEEITRIIGDGRVKGKMGADRKLMPDREFRGGIIATGEYVDLGTHSSYLRCFILNISKGDVNFDRLSALQQSPELAQAFFSKWVCWLETKQQSLFEKLPKWQMINLKTVSSCLQSEYARLTVSIAALLTTVECFGEFANDTGIAFNVIKAKEIVLMQAQQMYDMVKVVAPEQVAMNAVVEAVENGELNILADSKAFQQNPKADGYQINSTKYWIVASKLMNVIRRYAEINNYSVNFSTELKKSLVELGFLESIEAKKFSQTAKIRPRGYILNLKENEDGK